MPRVAIVTGGTRGIGRAICEELQNAGFTAVANYAGNDAAAAKCTEETGIPTYKWDVGDYQACQDGIAKVSAEQFEPIAFERVFSGHRLCHSLNPLLHSLVRLLALYLLCFAEDFSITLFDCLGLLRFRKFGDVRRR